MLGDILNFGSQMATNAQNFMLTKQQWKRDDNAVQRRSADLEAAGLSKTLAAGSGASSSAPISMQAPQLKAEYEAAKKGIEAVDKGIEKTDADIATAETIQDVNNQAVLTGKQNEATSSSQEALNHLNAINVAETTIGRQIENDRIALQLASEFRDFELLKKTGLMQNPPPGVTGQLGQGATSVVESLENLYNSGRGAFRDIADKVKDQNANGESGPVRDFLKTIQSDPVGSFIREKLDGWQDSRKPPEPERRTNGNVE